MHVGGTGRAPNAIKCCERASPHTLQLQTVLDTPSSPHSALRMHSARLLRAPTRGISLAILTKGHRPYNILINLFNTQCNLFIRVKVARHTSPEGRVTAIVTHLHSRHIYIAVPTYRIQTQNQLFAHLYTQDVCIETLRLRENQFDSLNY